MGGGVSIVEVPKAGGVKIWKPSVVWYGYFLESPNNRIIDCTIKSLKRKTVTFYVECFVSRIQ